MSAAVTWDGWGSALVGGFLGALTVLLGAWAAYRLGETSRKQDRAETAERSAEDDRRKAAAQLMVEVSNFRDQVCSYRQGLGGSAEAWMLRNALYTTHVPLSKYPSYKVVDDFYDTALAWRQWIRDHQDVALTPADVVAHYPIVNEYRQGLRSYGDKVIVVLQDHLEDRSLNFSVPVLPALPDPRPHSHRPVA